MRFARYNDGSGVRVAVSLDATWHLVPDVCDVGQLVRLGRDGLYATAHSALGSGPICIPAEEQLLSPFDTPPTIRDFYAFEDHVRAGRASRGLEMDPVWYERPIFYFTNPYAVRGPGDVRMTPGTRQFDFELEIAAVLWGGGSDLSAAEGEDLVAGYCIMSDWSGRDIQHEEMRLSLGPAKGKDTATTLGPYFVTVDELADLRSGPGYRIEMSTRVNDKLYSTSSWQTIYWSFGEMIAYASRGTEVRAGDIIASGTTDRGCLIELRAGRPDDFPWLEPGDVVTFEVERLGRLVNRVIEGVPIRPLR